VRYRAWLDAVPEVKGLKVKPPPRWQQYQNLKGKLPALPLVISGHHLVGYLYEFGPTIAGQPVPFQEIDSWARTTRRRIDGWEAATLRQMSVAYAVQAQRSRDPDCPSPLEEKQDTPAQKGAKLVEKFKALNSSRRKRGRGRG
jgi:hypothetical protein